jgi:hypothetical protein
MPVPGIRKLFINDVRTRVRENSQAIIIIADNLIYNNYDYLLLSLGGTQFATNYLDLRVDPRPQGSRRVRNCESGKSLAPLMAGSGLFGPVIKRHTPRLLTRGRPPFGPTLRERPAICS